MSEEVRRWIAVAFGAIGLVGMIPLLLDPCHGDAGCSFIFVAVFYALFFAKPKEMRSMLVVAVLVLALVLLKASGLVSEIAGIPMKRWTLRDSVQLPVLVLGVALLALELRRARISRRIDG